MANILSVCNFKPLNFFQTSLTVSITDNFLRGMIGS